MFFKGKVDYTRILGKTSKEFVIVIKRTIKHERLDVVECLTYEQRGAFDVVLLTDSRLLIIRGYKSRKEAHIQEFQIDKWKAFTDQNGTNTAQFLRFYDREIQKLDQLWLT